MFLGQDSVQLSIAQMPIHTHIQDGHNHSLPAYANHATSTADNKVELTASSTARTASTNQATATNQNTGGGDGYHENRPKYFALAYIMKTNNAVVQDTRMCYL